jgi:hypothetical protein
LFYLNIDVTGVFQDWNSSDNVSQYSNQGVWGKAETLKVPGRTSRGAGRIIFDEIAKSPDVSP